MKTLITLSAHSATVLVVVVVVRALVLVLVLVLVPVLVLVLVLVLAARVVVEDGRRLCRRIERRRRWRRCAVARDWVSG
jgi:hypothetical protein